MIQAFRDSDANLSILKGKPIAVLGYGSQGRAQALNLRDSGCEVIIGVRAGASRESAMTDGFGALDIAEAVSGAQIVVFCLPDVEVGRIFENEVKAKLRAGAALVFAHGFAVHYGLIKSDSSHDLLLVAPMGAGPVVRARYEQRSGVPAMLAVANDASGTAWEIAKAYGSAIGCGRIAMLETTFREETESDLFGEQAVLCGGLPALMRAAYETLVEGGVRPEIAYIACVQEVKLIADLIYEKGLDGMVEKISSTAEWGAYETSAKLPNDATKQALRQVLANVQSGQFASNWIAGEAGRMSELERRRKEFLKHPIHELGKSVRNLLGIERN